MNLPDEVFAQATELAKQETDGWWSEDIWKILRTGAPVLTDYAYRKGREDALKEAREVVLVVQTELLGEDDPRGPHPTEFENGCFHGYGRGVGKFLHRALAALDPDTGKETEQ